MNHIAPPCFLNEHRRAAVRWPRMLFVNGLSFITAEYVSLKGHLKNSSHQFAHVHKLDRMSEA